ncbi:MAG: hypothetical protein R2711_12270 [Acidimicrobiales bacterium]
MDIEEQFDAAAKWAAASFTATYLTNRSLRGAMEWASTAIETIGMLDHLAHTNLLPGDRVSEGLVGLGLEQIVEAHQPEEHSTGSLRGGPLVEDEIQEIQSLETKQAKELAEIDERRDAQVRSAEEFADRAMARHPSPDAVQQIETHRDQQLHSIEQAHRRDRAEATARHKAEMTATIEKQIDQSREDP